MDPKSLPPVAKETSRSRAQSVFDFVAKAVWLLWLLAMRGQPFLILGPFAAVFNAAPVWHGVYPVLVVLAIAALLYPLIGLVRPQWERFSLVANLLLTMLNFAVLTFLTRVAVLTPNREWHPYVVLADPSYATRFANLDVIINLSILISIGVAWIVTFIMIIVEVWKLVKHVRKEAKRNTVAAVSGVM